MSVGPIIYQNFGVPFGISLCKVQQDRNKPPRRADEVFLGNFFAKKNLRLKNLVSLVKSMSEVPFFGSFARKLKKKSTQASTASSVSALTVIAVVGGSSLALSDVKFLKSNARIKDTYTRTVSILRNGWFRV